MKAIQIQSFGKPTEVARCVDIPDVGAPGANEVVLEVEATPINMSDLLMIAGAYGYRRFHSGISALDEHIGNIGKSCEFPRHHSAGSPVRRTAYGDRDGGVSARMRCAAFAPLG